MIEFSRLGSSVRVAVVAARRVDDASLPPGSNLQFGWQAWSPSPAPIGCAEMRSGLTTIACLQAPIFMTMACLQAPIFSPCGRRRQLMATACLQALICSRGRQCRSRDAQRWMTMACLQAPIFSSRGRSRVRQLSELPVVVWGALFRASNTMFLWVRGRGQECSKSRHQMRK